MINRYKIQCQFCPNMVERSARIKKTTCFDCKMRRAREYNHRPKQSTPAPSPNPPKGRILETESGYKFEHYIPPPKQTRAHIPNRFKPSQ